MKHLLLDFLYSHEETTGYAFLRHCEMEGMRVSNGTIYPHLKHLEEKGIISGRTDGRKRFYSLTQKGRVLVRLHQDKPMELRKSLIHFLHLFAMEGWDSTDNIVLLRRHLADVDKELGLIAEKRKANEEEA